VSNEDFKWFCEVLQNDWQTWLSNLFNDIKIQFNAKIPEAGSWDFFQENYFSVLHKSVNEAFNYLLIDNFSIREYAYILLEITKRAGRLRKKYNIYHESEELKAYYRTAIALQVSTAHVLAIITWPVMPNFASKLYTSLGFPGSPIQDWATLPELLPTDQAISSLPLIFKVEHEFAAV
jgi:methionyl-tRNA synthetase